MGRAEYSGFLMSLPPRRLYDVWQDADYQFAESKSERLLLAALDYSIRRHVVYVAAKPPRSIFKTIASRAGRTIVYIPIGQLSPASLKKIRVVHVLDGYDKRELAKEYL
jgi:Mor family transcriptional regulator